MRMSSAVSVFKTVTQEKDILLPRDLKIASKVEHEFVDLSLSLFLKKRNSM